MSSTTFLLLNFTILCTHHTPAGTLLYPSLKTSIRQRFGGGRYIHELGKGPHSRSVPCHLTSTGGPAEGGGTAKDRRSVHEVAKRSRRGGSLSVSTTQRTSYCGQRARCGGGGEVCAVPRRQLGGSACGL